MTERSLGCARCGDCCEEIYLSASLDLLKRWTSEALVGVPDPATDDGWAWWISRDRGTDAWRDNEVERQAAIDRYQVDGESRRNADFIVEHWSLNEDGETFSCDRFDRDHRTCRAQDEKPPVCSGYPWYDHGPRPDKITKEGSRCSYLLDLSSGDRPKNSYPLIPIEVINR